VDYSEYGTRMTYGTYSLLDLKNGYGLEGFIGKFDYLSNNNVPYFSKIGNLGDLALFHEDTGKLYYKFRGDKKFTPHDQYIGAMNTLDKFSWDLGYIISRPSLYYNHSTAKPLVTKRVNQYYIDLAYSINDTWSVGWGTQVDVTNRNSPLYQNGKLTYKGDCANIEFRIRNDYTQDKTLGIEKTGGYSISMGLKNISI
jgi:hypothetical protein